MNLRRWVGGGWAAVFVAIVSGLSAAPAVGRVPNACKIVGASRTFAHTLFGKGATFFEEIDGPSTPQNIGSDCSLRPAAPKRTAAPTHGGLDIELYPAAAFAQLAGICRGPGRKLTHLKALGAGAVYCISKDHSYDDLMFKKGPYAAFVYSTIPARQRSSLYPTKKQYLALAHHAYAHIH